MTIEKIGFFVLLVIEFSMSLPILALWLVEKKHSGNRIEVKPILIAVAVIGLALYFAFCTDVFATFEANISQNPSLVIIAAFLYMVLISEVFGK